MSLLSVVERVSQHRPRPFVAPVLDADRVEVLVHIDSIPYRFVVRDVQPGWWVLAPDGRRAVVDREAYPYEYLPYMSMLPRFYAITCYHLSMNTWLVVPFNASDCHQRGWLNGSPRPMHLVRESVRPLSVVDVRDLAGTLLFSQSVVGGNFQPVDNNDWGRATGLITARREELERLVVERRRQAQLEQIAARRQTVEDRIRFDLEFVGAELIDWSERGNGLRVTWEYDGYQDSATFSREERLESAGICLGDRRGDYEWHTLGTTVLAIQDGRRLRRFDIDGEAWL